jgi:hypothetical protein
MNDNKLIAEFMGAEKTHIQSVGDIYCPVPSKSGSEYADKLQYHNSWDWLMPVAQKCRLDSRCEYDDDDFWNDIHWALEECNLDSTYKAVVEFIKEHKTHTT